MKIFLVVAFAAIFILSGCYSGKHIQVEMVKAKLVRIDTVYRYDNKEVQQLTWTDNLNIEYTSFADMQTMFVVGTKMLLLRQR